MKVKQKKDRFIRLIMSATIISPLIVLGVIFTLFMLIVLPKQFDMLLTQKRNFIKQIVKNNIQIIERTHRQVFNGEISLEEAKKRGRVYIQGFRWGEDQLGYTFILDDAGNMLVHPFNPELVNTNVIDLEDTEGVPLIRLLLKEADKGGGFIDYKWSNPEDPSGAINKMTYTEEYEPWGWIVSSGVYYDDIIMEHAEVRNDFMLATVLFFSAILTLVILLLFVISNKNRQAVRSLHRMENSETKFMDLFNNSMIFVALLDRDARLLEANKISLDLIHADIRQLRGQHFIETPWWKHDPKGAELFKSALAACRVEKNLQRFETSQVFPDTGLEMVIEFRLTPLINENDNEIRGFIAEAIDITEKKATADQMQHKKRMESIGELAGGVAHDFNNMLAVIQGAIEILKTPGEDEESLSESLDMVESTVDRAASLVRKLLDFSRAEKLNMVELELNSLIRETVHLLSSTADRKIKIAAQSSLREAPIIGDKPTLINAMLNIGINSVKAISGKGNILFNLDCIMPDEQIPGGLVPDREYYRLTISDDGCGIAAEEIDKIFNPFYTSRKQGEGTGLGLSSAYGTIREHEGEIQVQSEPGSGTRFTLFLPASKSTHEGQIEAEKTDEDSATPRFPNEVTPRKQSGSTQRETKQSILIVDDEEHIRKILTRGLAKQGFRVHAACNGLEAIEKVDQYASEVSLMVLDMIMPEMDGEECFHEIKKRLPDLPVILTTGYGDEERISRMRAGGLNAELHKPYRMHKLLQLIRTLLNP